MKLSKWALALAIAAASLPGAAVFAQVGSGVSPQNRTSGQPATYSYGDYYSSQPTEDPGVTREAEAFDEIPEEEAAEEAEEPWSLIQRTPGGFTIRGWLQGGTTHNARGNQQTNGNFGVPFNNINGPAFNQGWIYAERVASTEDQSFNWGARIDYIYGADGPDTQAFGDRGWDFNWNSSGQYGSAIPQIYFELAYNDVSVKIGHFFTIIGYEVVPATGNFFYSHAYTMNFGEPFTHTGALGKWVFDERFTFFGGYTMGWDSGFSNHLNAHTFLGGLTWTMSENTSLAIGMNAGRFGDGTAKNGVPGALGNVYIQSVVFSHSFWDNWQYVFQSDYGANTNNGGPNTRWYGANQYLFYNFNDKWAAGVRGEWFRDADGARIADPAGNTFAGNFTAITAGINWKPHPNFRFRPEIRWDWHDGVGTPYNPDANGNGQSSSLFTLGVDGIFLF